MAKTLATQSARALTEPSGENLAVLVEGGGVLDRRDLQLGGQRHVSQGGELCGHRRFIAPVLEARVQKETREIGGCIPGVQCHEPGRERCRSASRHSSTKPLRPSEAVHPTTRCGTRIGEPPIVHDLVVLPLMAPHALPIEEELDEVCLDEVSGLGAHDSVLTASSHERTRR